VNSAYNRSYGYDFFSRLTSMTAPNTPSADSSFVYDRWGNLYQATGSENWNVAINSGTNQIQGFSYDNDGRLTGDGTAAYTWNALGLMTGYNPGAASTYAYDAFGRRVRAATPAGTFDYFYDVNGALRGVWNDTNGRWQQLEIGLGSASLETYNAAPPSGYSNFTYTGTSLLGSTAFRYNPGSGGIAKNYHFLPYGLEWPGEASDATSNLKWTGHEQDSESGLYHFLFRNYAPLENRWLSPDPAGWAAADPVNPQSWNFYSYVQNSPESRIDICGLCTFNISITSPLPGNLLKMAEAQIASIFESAGQNVSFSGQGDTKTYYLRMLSDASAFSQVKGIGDNPAVLGYTPGGGAVGYEFEDRIASTLGRSLAQFPVLLGAALGRVGAHEAGHFFIGPGHTPGTLMQKQFSSQDLSAALSPNMEFSSAQQLAALARACPVQTITVPIPNTPIKLEGGPTGPATPSGGISIDELYWEWLTLQDFAVVTTTISYATQ